MKTKTTKCNNKTCDFFDFEGSTFHNCKSPYAIAPASCPDFICPDFIALKNTKRPKFPNSKWTVVGYFPQLNKAFCCYVGDKKSKLTAEEAVREVCENHKILGEKLIILGAVFGGNIMTCPNVPLKTY